MLQEKQDIKRSVMDRRSFIERRVLTVCSTYSDTERRTNKDRRKGWEDRVDCQPASQWGLFLTLCLLSLQGCHEKSVPHI